MMKNIIRFMTSSVFLFCLECTNKTSSTEMVFNTYVKQPVKAFDPIRVNDFFSQQTIAQVYEGLYHFHYLKRPLEVEPLLAEGLPSVSADRLKYTIRIKKGVFFHDSPAFKNGKGRELCAEDFIYSWKRLADPKNKSENYWVFRDKIKGLSEWRENMSKGSANYDSAIEGFRTPDTRTIEIQLTKPDAQLIYILASSMTFVVAREVVEHFGEDFGSHPIGTGPFVLQSWVRGSKLVLIKNTNYHEVVYPNVGTEDDLSNGMLVDAGKKLPFLDKVVINEIEAEQPQWLMFLKGQLDHLFVPKDNMELVVKDKVLQTEYKNKKMQLQLVSSADVAYISFNTENKFLKNKKLRQAMALAYDKVTLHKKFYAGLGVIAHGPIPPAIAGYRNTVNSPFLQYDLVAAKKMLAEAGYPSGKGLPEFTFELGAAHSTARQMAEFFKQQMALLGIKIKLNVNTWAQFSDKVSKKKADVFDMAWNADYPDGENFLQLFYSQNVSPGPNNSNFQNKNFDALYEAALEKPPGEEKNSLYQKMEDILIEETPWIFNIHRQRVVLSHGWLKNFKQEVIILDGIKHYRIDLEQKNRLMKEL